MISEMFVKILKDELVELLGGEKKELNLNGNPAVLMLVGLQGTGKTTMIGKLGLLLRKRSISTSTLFIEYLSATSIIIFEYNFPNMLADTNISVVLLIINLLN